MANGNKAKATTQPNGSTSVKSKDGQAAPRTATAAAASASASASPTSAPLLASQHSPALLVPAWIFFVAAVAAVAVYFHYQLPTPVSSKDALASTTGLFSEERALGVMQKLSEDIGYRIVGTTQHVEAEEWLLDQMRQYEGIHNLGGNGDAGDVQVEVWHQVGDGAHRFDFMGSTVWKKYYSMSNVIVRISDGTPESKEHAVLLNAHLDSTLPSPGASDDGIGVGIMVDLVRILTSPRERRRRLKHSLVLLFNNGEESLQDASHLYITSNHTTVPSIRSVVNLEACGVSGPELLFQAASTEMINAYSNVPHPFGTVLANDVFSSGIVLSDTDYRQFVEYGKVVGLDMAIVGNSYLYHTRKDVIANMQPGAVQHFGENILAIVDYLTTADESRLKHVAATPRSEAPIYFTLLGRYFIQIPNKTFRGLSTAISVFSHFLLHQTVRAERHFSALGATALSIGAVLGSLLGALIGANVQALIMTRVMDKSLSWFRGEWLPIPLYGPPALVGILASQALFARFIAPEHRPYLERSSLSALGLVFVLALLLFNAFSIGSAYLFALGGAGALVTIIVNDFVLVGWENIEGKTVPANRRIHAAAYFIISLVPAVVGAEGLTAFLELFVPLTGRTGEISPADHIIATIVSSLAFLALPALIPLSHRFGPDFLRRAILFFVSMSITAIFIYSGKDMAPFDAMHPKRLFVHQVHNLTSGEWWMNLGGADPSPESLFRGLADGLHAEYGVQGEEAYRVEMNAYNPDFDILYPVSDFITPWKFRLPSGDDDGGDSLASSHPASFFRVTARDDALDLAAGTRTLTLQVDHPHVIWSVLAFDADILSWDLPVVPPKGYRRHHIKEVSRHGVDVWSVTMTIKLQDWQLEAAKLRASGRLEPFGRLLSANPSSSEGVHAQYNSSSSSGLRDRLLIDYSGLWGEAMFPLSERSHADSPVRSSPGVKRFQEMDKWLAEKHPEVDAMMLNVLAGVAVA